MICIDQILTRQSKHIYSSQTQTVTKHVKRAIFVKQSIVKVISLFILLHPGTKRIQLRALLIKSHDIPELIIDTIICLYEIHPPIDMHTVVITNASIWCTIANIVNVAFGDIQL